MGLRWTATATSISARCRGPTGRKLSETSHGRIICARCTSSGRWYRSVNAQPAKFDLVIKPDYREGARPHGAADAACACRRGDRTGWVYVADRENHRVQVFDGNGKYETQWNNLHRPCGLFMPPGKGAVCYIGERGAVQPVSRNVPNLGPRVTIVDNTGKRISRLGGLGPGLGPTEFLAPHGLAVDSHGDLYIGEVSWTNWPQT